MVQWLRLHASKTGDMGLIPVWGTKIPPATQYSQIIKRQGGGGRPLKSFKEQFDLGHDIFL